MGIKIEDLWYRFALSFVLVSICLLRKPCANMMCFQHIGTHRACPRLIIRPILSAESPPVVI